MTFRRKLLAAFALMVFFSVGVVTWTVLLRTRQAFERAEADRTAALVEQLRKEFQRRGEQVTARVEDVARSETAIRMASDLVHGAEPGGYLTEAKSLADAYQLEFLELVQRDGTIISSAQWPGRFGYKVSLPSTNQKTAFLRLQELPAGVTLGSFALRQVGAGDSVFVLGGEKMDSDFLSSLSLPVGTRAILYRNPGTDFQPQAMLTAGEKIQDPAKLASLIARVQQSGTDASENIYWSRRVADSESFQGIALKGEDGSVLGVLLIGSSRKNFVDLQHHIRTVGFVVGGIGVLLAIVLSGWIAARVTRPVEELATAAAEVASGDWNRQVAVTSRDEIGQLAESFNRMTRELLDQRDRLVQTERVAAWRELARRLAHELKNPLFPLQITVENLIRARGTEHFDEVLTESASTLLAELANLKLIIGRFSDFSKMPQPQFQRVQINDLIGRIIALHEAQFSAPGRAQVTARVELDSTLPEIDADPELLHRVFANLVLNAMDAMPQGGTLSLRTLQQGDRIRIEVSDSGVGLTPEESARLFTPYYTTKQHGTGLGLAIAQSVISDHHGTITVESVQGHGAKFVIELPLRAVNPVAASTAAPTIS
jgi:two-component system, NtrC family, nitrogen regulation sensor histidine kinase NtrY